MKGAIRAIVHEIGHAVDRVPLRAAWATYGRSRETSADDARLTAARARSGLRYVLRRGTFEEVEGGNAGVSFRTAAQRDGPAGITNYAQTNWEERFAESYSFLLTDPRLLQQLRPHTFAWFVANLPGGGAASPQPGQRSPTRSPGLP